MSGVPTGPPPTPSGGRVPLGVPKTSLVPVTPGLCGASQRNYVFDCSRCVFQVAACRTCTQFGGFYYHHSTTATIRHARSARCNRDRKRNVVQVSRVSDFLESEP